MMADQKPHTENAVVRFLRWLTGQRATKLREKRARLSVFGALLLIVQSVSMILVFGHAELAALFTGTLMARIVMTAVLALLVLVTIAADGAALKTLGRIPALARNRMTGMVAEHVIYLVFVLGIEAVTLGIALYTIEQNPMALLSTEPLLPSSSWLVWGLIVLRVLLMGFTFIQQHLVDQELPSGWETLADQGAQLIGGHAQTLMSQMELTSADLGKVFDAYAKIRTPQPRRPHWWNGWLIRRDQEHQQAQEVYRREVIAAMEALGHKEREELEQRVAAAEAKLAETIARANERIADAEERAQEQAIEWTSRAMTALATGADLPDWLLEARPELAGITLGKRATTRGKATGNGGVSTPKSPSDAKRMFLDNLGISAAKPPDKKRGIWVRSSDIGTLSEGAIAKEEATAMARRLGDGARDGLPYIAPLDAVMQELMERHKLSEATAKAWGNITQSGGDTGEHDAVTRLDSWRQARG